MKSGLKVLTVFSFMMPLNLNKAICCCNQDHEDDNCILMTETFGKFTKLLVDISNNLYAINENGTVYIKNNDEINFINLAQIPEEISCITGDSRGNIYIGTISGNVYKKFASSNDFFVFGNIDRSIVDLVVDADDNVYLIGALTHATIEGVKLNNTIYKNSNSINGFCPIWGTKGQCFTIKADLKANVVYIGNERAGVYKVYASETETNDIVVSIKGIPTNKEISVLAVGNDKNVYVATKDCLLYRSDGTNDFIEIKSFNRTITDLAVDANNDIFIKFDDDVYWFNEGGNDLTAIKKINDSILDFVTDRQGDVYIGTSKGYFKKASLVKK